MGSFEFIGWIEFKNTQHLKNGSICDLVIRNLHINYFKKEKRMRSIDIW